MPLEKPFEFPFASSSALSALSQSLILHCPQIQRLSRVAQLGQAPSVLGFSAHSRLEHCIAVAKLSREFARRIICNSGFPLSSLGADEELAVEVAGLMHDVGHGPFSHTFEKLKIAPEGWCHELESGRIIREVLPSFAQQLGIENWEILVEKVHWLVTRKGPRPQFNHPWVCDIVNSSGGTLGLDMDRCDYLMRDSFYWQGALGTVHLDAVECVQLLLEGCRVESLCSDRIIAEGAIVQRVAQLRTFMFENLYFKEAVLLEEEKLMGRVKESENIGKIQCNMDDFQFMQAL